MKKFLFVLLLLGAGGYYGYTKYYVPWRAGGAADGGAGGSAGAGGGKGRAVQPGLLFEAKRYGEAIEPLRAELAELEAKKSPEVARNLYYLAVSLAETGKADESAALTARLEKEFAASPFTGEALFRAARAAKEEGEREKLLARVYRSYPKTAGAQEFAVAEAARLAKDAKEWDLWFALSCQMRLGPAPEERARLAAQMEPLVRKFIFSPEQTQNSVDHEVRPSELLSTIGRKYGVEYGLIKRTNNMSKDTIFPKQHLKIVQGKADIVVSKGNFRLSLYYADRWVNDWPVGIGVIDKSPTPEGVFTVDKKLIDPPWKDKPFGHPDNILGTRWMGFEERPDYGIHGTTKPETVGTPSSNGCVRMRNEEVEVL
ncbi:MAG: L,D-transpeptidase family protein, partial [Planctomycetes bacterium]|nr:L,D-transpeptidase family protein [Planctomycetota bacterium]